MWNKLKEIFAEEKEVEDITSDNAIATILVRAAKTDNEYTESEQMLIDNLLSNQLNITLEEAQILRIKGEGLEAEINEALSDGFISDNEAKKIEKLRKELNLSPEHSKSLIDILTDRKK